MVYIDWDCCVCEHSTSKTSHSNVVSATMDFAMTILWYLKCIYLSGEHLFEPLVHIDRTMS